VWTNLDLDVDVNGAVNHNDAVEVNDHVGVNARQVVSGERG
jgi:hypothetical protein